MPRTAFETEILGRAVIRTPAGWIWQCFACGETHRADSSTVGARRMAIRAAKDHVCTNLRSDRSNKLRDPSRCLRVVLEAAGCATMTVDEKGATIRLTLEGRHTAGAHNRATVETWQRRARLSRERMAQRKVLTHRQKLAQQ